jgi:NAD(P)-dependent dehydrogenase (short-subunit alcohol dehydrogenase family)
MSLPVAPDASVLGDGHVALVTGASSGIGREIAHNLATVGVRVLAHGRDRERTRATVDELPGSGHEWYLADFADLAAVRELANTVRDEADRLDCLVNNAGTWQADRHLVDVPGTDDGVELTFAVNHLAPFLLTRKLATRLARTADRRAEEYETAGPVDADVSHREGGAAGTGAGHETDSEETVRPARVVTVSSELHRRVEMDRDAVVGPEGPSGVDAYALSKLANVMFTSEFARRGPAAVTATCCHPGTAPATGLARDGSLVAGLGWRLFGLVGNVVDVTDSPADAAETPTYLACSPQLPTTGGNYFEDCKQTRSSEASVDREAQRLLWTASEQWTGIEQSQ